MPNKYKGAMPKPRPNYGAMKRSDVTRPTASREMSSSQMVTKKPTPPRPRPAYRGVTGNYSTD